MVFIVAVMLMDTVNRIAVYAIPIWIVLMWICHSIKHKRSVSQDLYGEA
jgi:aromatic amino acid transport protein AroP